MPRNNSGVYSLPSGTTAVTGTTISSTAYNAFINDMASEMTGSLPRSGTAGMSGPLAMAGNKITGLAAGSSTGDAATFDQIGSAFFQSGTVMLFQQTAAPVGWTKLTTHNDKTLRVVSGTVGSGGTNAFSAYMAVTVTGGHSLIQSEHASYNLTTSTLGVSTVLTNGGAILQGGNTGASASAGGQNNIAQNQSQVTITAASSLTGTLASGGSGTAHTHGLTRDIQYVDLIFASKN